MSPRIKDFIIAILLTVAIVLAFGAIVLLGRYFKGVVQ
jgi:hypothetical protein